MTTRLSIIVGPETGEIVNDLDQLAETYELHLVRASSASELPAAAAGHLLVTSSVPEPVVAEIAARSAESVHGLVLLTDTAESDALAGHVGALAAWGAPTLVVAASTEPLRETGQRLSAGIPDAVFVVTEAGAPEPEATTVHWVASFLSIVDGLRAQQVDG